MDFYRMADESDEEAQERKRLEDQAVKGDEDGDDDEDDDDDEDEEE